MKTDDIIMQILSQRPQLSRETIIAKLQAERDKTNGLIADETLLRLIAADYGVKIASERDEAHKLSISNLVPNLNDVVVTGKVLAIGSVKAFKSKTWGKYVSLIVADENDLIRVMLWNSMAGLVESGELKNRCVIRFIHGYTRQGRDGRVELHISDKSVVEIDPPYLKTDYPSIIKFTTKIGAIAASHERVHIVGVVKAVYPLSTFTRQDSTTGKMLRFTLMDDSGEVTVVAWNEKAEELTQRIYRDAHVALVNAKVRAAANGGFEVQVDSLTFVTVLALDIRPSSSL
ncbi:MAG: OB-fold nucleic acid binding domain-containing protein [Candidatus Bathyarchaeia archaeon]